jgi:hypothetical protein
MRLGTGNGYQVMWDSLDTGARYAIRPDSEFLKQWPMLGTEINLSGRLIAISNCKHGIFVTPKYFNCFSEFGRISGHSNPVPGRKIELKGLLSIVVQL